MGILLAILVDLSLEKSMLFGNFGKKMSDFSNSCKEAQIFLFRSRECECLASFVWKTSTHVTFDVEISLGKGINFIIIGLANGSIVKLWAAQL